MAHRTDKTREENPTNDEQANRNPVKVNDYKGEAQNVNDGEARMSGEEAERARNKATEGQNQGRNNQQ